MWREIGRDRERRGERERDRGGGRRDGTPEPLWTFFLTSILVKGKPDFLGCPANCVRCFVFR